MRDENRSNGEEILEKLFQDHVVLDPEKLPTKLSLPFSEVEPLSCKTSFFAIFKRDNRLPDYPADLDTKMANAFASGKGTWCYNYQCPGKGTKRNYTVDFDAMVWKRSHHKEEGTIVLQVQSLVELRKIAIVCRQFWRPPPGLEDQAPAPKSFDNVVQSTFEHPGIIKMGVEKPNDVDLSIKSLADILGSISHTLCISDDVFRCADVRRMRETGFKHPFFIFNQYLSSVGV